ncbi:hypothetical protein RvY_06933 [Ramazzottius varieornatus]|uniref:Uncharacterized protein n=1 Tax=Ramazzottius varieornatus TaxID=947166 RepID=A0A1D1V9V7_RAMVA|nr:hypothetical protein RvY_06933 [Ramazzottius varieornatus]
MSISGLFRQQEWGCSALMFRYQSSSVASWFPTSNLQYVLRKKVRKGDAPGRVQISQILGKRDPI